MADIVTSQDSIDLQNKSVDLIGKEGKLFLIQIKFFVKSYHGLLYLHGPILKEKIVGQTFQF